MVDLQNLKNAITNSEYSEDAKRAMTEIIDSAIAKGSMGPEQKERLLSIMDLEIDENKAVQKVHEDVAEMLESFVYSADAVNQTGADNLDALQEEQISPAESPTQSFETQQPQPEAATLQMPATPVQSETPQTPAQ